jgi:histone H2B
MTSTDKSTPIVKGDAPVTVEQQPAIVEGAVKGKKAPAHRPEKRPAGETTGDQPKKKKSKSAPKKKKSKAADGTAVGGAEAVEKKKRKKRHGPEYTRYGTYIRKLVAERHPESGISSGAVSTLSAFVEDYIDRLGRESNRLMKYKDVQTMRSIHPLSSVYMICTGDLAAHLTDAGKLAVSKLTGAQSLEEGQKKQDKEKEKTTTTTPTSE